VYRLDNPPVSLEREEAPRVFELPRLAQRRLLSSRVLFVVTCVALAFLGGLSPYRAIRIAGVAALLALFWVVVNLRMTARWVRVEPDRVEFRTYLGPRLVVPWEAITRLVLDQSLSNDQEQTVVDEMLFVHRRWAPRIHVEGRMSGFGRLVGLMEAGCGRMADVSRNAGGGGGG